MWIKSHYFNIIFQVPPLLFVQKRWHPGYCVTFNIRVKWYNNISKEVESSLIKINRHPFYIFCLLNYISWLCCLYFCLLDVCIGLILMCACLGGCMAEDASAQPLAVTPASASQELCSPASLLTSLCLSLFIEKRGMTIPNTRGCCELWRI